MPSVKRFAKVNIALFDRYRLDYIICDCAACGAQTKEYAELLHDDLEWLHAALADLPEEQRRAVVLAGVWGLSAREISEQDEIPLGTAKTRIRIALRRLRDALHERESTEPEARVEPCT